MFDVIWIMFDVILPHPASCIGELTLLLVLRSQKMFDVLWMMDDVLRDVRCMMAEGRCVISLFHSHLVSYIYAQVP